MQSLAHYIRCYEEHLPAALCTQLIEQFEQQQSLQQANGVGIRPGLEDSAWVEMDISRSGDAQLGKTLVQTASQAYQQYNQDMGLTLNISAPQRLDRWIIKRYQANSSQSFQAHFDSLGPVCNRYLVMLWYLNDVSEGGETEFVDLDTRIQARQGRLLMFPPYWMFQHRGLPAISNDKYILSTYLTYS